jgi:hypothetical protein
MKYKFDVDQIAEDPYRCQLKLVFQDEKPLIAFVGLNPSTADDKKDDRTIRKCINYCKIWGYGGFYMVNLFAYRETDRSQIYKVENPNGPENDFYLKRVFDDVELVICCWGNDGVLKARNKEVLEMIKEPFCLSVNSTGELAHPLYLNNSLILLNIMRKRFLLRDRSDTRKINSYHSSKLWQETIILNYSKIDFGSSRKNGQNIPLHLALRWEE